MVNYYWDKYTANAKPTLQSVNGSSEYQPTLMGDGIGTGYSYDPITEQFNITGLVSSTPWAVGAIRYLKTENYNYPGKSLLGEYKADGNRSGWWNRVNYVATGVTYERGTLVQNNIVADETAFIDNARYTDGYWYVRKGVVNSAPTMPGAFTQPTGTLEIGDSKTISWGASTDAERNLAHYILEVSINNGAWTQIGIPTVNNFTYTIPPIPTATKIQFRVKAQDSAGLESGYRTSSVFTVTKPKYYYSKYDTNTSYNYSRITSSTRTLNLTGTENLRSMIDNFSQPVIITTAHSSITIDASGKFVGSSVASQTLSDWIRDSVGKSINYVDTATNKVYAYAIGPANTDTLYLHPINQYIYTVSQGSPVYTRGSLIQSGISAEDGVYPNNGRHSDGYWYVRGSRVNQSIEPPKGITSPENSTVFRTGNTVSITFTASTAANISAYEVDYRYNNDAWTPLATNATLTRSLTATTDSTKTTLEFRIRAKNTSNVYSDYIYSPLYTIQHNVVPVVTLNTENNKTLYENDSFEISGTVQDVDNGNTVTIRYQISGGNERAIKAYLSNSSVELFSKTLTFKGGKLYDGETLITGDLVDGTPYTLHVWATDDKGGMSTIAERTFYVVPNRAPLLTVNTPVIEGNIDADTIQITGTFSDPDGNNAKVSYRINSGNSVQVAEGTNGVFDFGVSFGQLVIGENTIVIEVVDSYGAKITKTIKLNKALLETPLLKNTERYRLLPPSGSAAGVLFYVQRNEQLAIEVAISMTQAAEAEQFTSLSPVTTAPLSQGSTIVEDEFYHAIPEPVDNIILQIDFTRTTTTAAEKIYVIMGAFN